MSNSKPIIALPADCLWHVNRFRYSVAKQYIDIILDIVDAIPIIIPNLKDINLIKDLVSKVDGILVPGGTSNVHPSLYGLTEFDAEVYGPFDPERDFLSINLIKAAIEAKLPALCICRGLQELNVALGGTLDAEVQTLPNRLDHRAAEGVAPDEAYALKHKINISKDGLLASILKRETAITNSLHRQAIHDLAESLTIEALAEDGTIEAVSLKDRQFFLLALQFHPEYWAKSEEVSNKIITAFKHAVYENKSAKLAI